MGILIPVFPIVYVSVGLRYRYIGTVYAIVNRGVGIRRCSCAILINILAVDVVTFAVLRCNSSTLWKGSFLQKADALFEVFLSCVFIYARDILDGHFGIVWILHTSKDSTESRWPASDARQQELVRGTG